MISYKGYDTQVITIHKSSDNLQAGEAVYIDLNGNAARPTSGVHFVGVCCAVRGENVSVQTEGYVEAEYTGTAPTHGFVQLVADGNGKIKVNNSDPKCIYRKVLTVDTENNIVGFIL